MHVKKLFFSGALILLLVACSSPQPSYVRILGSTHVFDGAKILLDAKVGNLRIRHVKRPSEDCVEGVYDHIELNGDIGPDSTLAVGQLLSKIVPCRSKNGGYFAPTVYLSSGGGLLADGFQLGHIFRRYNVGTAITGGQTCASACATAFLGGRHRAMYADAKLMFHAPYRTNGYFIDCTNTGQVDELRKYYAEMIGDKNGEYLLSRTMSYCSTSDGWELNADGAKLFGITTHR